MNINHSMHDRVKHEKGFTLIEMVISMGMSLVLLAGIISVFTSMGKTSSAASLRTERMGDLYLMSQIMQEALRFSLKCRQNAPQQPLPNTCSKNPNPVDSTSQGVIQNLNARSINLSTALPGYPTTESAFDQLPYWDSASKSLTYQNQDGEVGIFHYQHNGNNDAIFWLRADSSISTFDELSRNMAVTDGLCVLDSNNNNVCFSTNVPADSLKPPVSSIKLLATYLNEAHQSKTLSLSFKVWPRN